MRVAIAALALVFGTPVGQAAELPADFAELRAKDERVQRIGYALATANAPFCDYITLATGLLLHDVAAYGEADRLRTALGLSGDIGVQAVVPGSPAATAGLLADQTLVSVGGQPTDTLPLDRKKRWQRLFDLRERMDEQLVTLEPLALEFAGPGGSVSLTGVPACHSRFEVGPLGKRAVADGDRVVIGEDFPGFGYADELLAAAIAHEMAHNVLRHRAWFHDNGGRRQDRVRVTEREADRLMPWLLANAGYDPAAAVRFMETWGPKHGGWIFRKRTHDGWDERAEFIEAELPTIERAMASTGKANWKSSFRREDLAALVED